MAGQPPPPSKGGLSLYANLLDPKAGSASSISRAPVVFKQSGEDGDTRDEGSARKSVDPALRFQPIRRPQVKPATKAKPGFPKAIQPGAANAVSSPTANATAITAAQPPRSTLADWAATEEDEFIYGTGEKRQRGGRKKKKKKNDDRPAETDWDELYDPARPTNVEEYLRSDERIAEVREWKAILYAHRRRRRDSYDSEMGSEEDIERPTQFAPPPSYSFAPPPLSPPRGRGSPAVFVDATGDDAYARRLAMSGNNPTAPPPRADSPPLPSSGTGSAPDAYRSAPPPPESPNSPPPPPPPPPEVSAPADSTTISRAPVRYEPPPDTSPPPPDSMDIDVDNDYDVPPPEDAAFGSGSGSASPAPRSNRPGQAGFAARLMSKYGWTKGSGLGAKESGIVNPLRFQVEKRRRRPDAEGGGFADPGGRGKIVGGSKKKRDGGEDDGEGFGQMSEVIVLRGMLDGMEDLQAEVEDGLGQEIGEECGEKYGRVERLYIDVVDRQVFIKFTDQVSALRAVNALQGRNFGGNTIMPKFYDPEKFEKGEYR